MLEIMYGQFVYVAIKHYHGTNTRVHKCFIVYSVDNKNGSEYIATNAFQILVLDKLRHISFKLTVHSVTLLDGKIITQRGMCGQYKGIESSYLYIFAWSWRPSRDLSLLSRTLWHIYCCISQGLTPYFIHEMHWLSSQLHMITLLKYLLRIVKLIEQCLYPYMIVRSLW